MSGPFIITFKEKGMLKPESIACRILPAVGLVWYPENLAVYKLKGILIDTFKEAIGVIETADYRSGSLSLKGSRSILYILDDELLAVIIGGSEDELKKFVNILKKRLDDETNKALKEGVRNVKTPNL